VNRLAQIVAAALGKERRTVHLDERKEVKIAFSDHSKVERFFGRKEKTPLESGVRSMAEWVRSHGARESATFENIEINRNLPPSWGRTARVGV